MCKPEDLSLFILHLPDNQKYLPLPELSIIVVQYLSFLSICNYFSMK